ncbi:hypothetical protein RSO01_24810 [Reyranella soli]|uniref:Uncharacterized protein n=1 Tax=Reyranella soli TaxID=1230389 RepID=A0A512N8K1_9HYPH|nr:hypothetical protein RSO01_24810 [Reyranella soli]
MAQLWVETGRFVTTIIPLQSNIMARNQFTLAEVAELWSIRTLRGLLTLACRRALDQPCHVDVYLKVANR